jgi:hypothetical protein
MAKKKKKIVQKRTSQFNLGNFIIQHSRKLPLHKIFLDETMYSMGLGYCIVSRVRPNGEIIYGNFLIDRFCLGIKDVFFDCVSEKDFNDIIEGFQEEGDVVLVEKDANYVFNMIYGAMEYGYDNGFDPHPDFDVAEYLLDDVDNIEYVELEFGVNGKPVFIAGPKDKSGRIISTLKKSRGEGNFEFMLYSEVLAMNHEDDEEEFEDDDEYYDEEE